jgi:CRISPR-associated protein Cmr4
MATRLLFIHAMTPLHAGTGQAVGGIDLPIARERPTGIPLVPGSSIKGALRARDTSDLATVIFGPPTEAASDGSGAVQIADAHLVLLPVRSLAGTFAWVTSPYLLSRFARDAKEASLEVPVPPRVPRENACLVLGNKLQAHLGNLDKVVLEDLDFLPVAEPSAELASIVRTLGECLFPGGGASEIAARQSLADRICLIHDDTMAYLLESATEVMARIRLDDEKKTVAKGALWYEEALPAESILVGLALASRVRRAGTTHEASALLSALERNAGGGLVQLGGKATVGRGLCRVQFAGSSQAGAR